MSAVGAPKMKFGIFLSSLVFVCLTGCGVEEVNWTEEIRLPDGHALVLNRHAELGGRYEPGQSPTLSKNWFEFVHPDTGEKIRYEGTGAFYTAALFRANQSMYLVLEYGVGIGNRDDGCPEPPFVFLKYGEGAWARIAFSQSPVKKLETNMTQDPKASKNFIHSKGGRLTSADIRADIDSYPRAPTAIDITEVPEPKLKCPKFKKQ